MSRSALLVAGALFALGVLVALLTVSREGPGVAPPAPVAQDTAPTPGLPAPVAGAAPPPSPGATPPPRISTRDELAAVLAARGLDADRLIGRYQDWRIARGFLGEDPLTGMRRDDSLLQVYTAMDRTTQKALADSGDLGAIQAYAAANLPGDPFTAIDYYRRASEQGSAAAMLALAGTLADIGAPTPGNGQFEESFASRLLALRGGDPARDLRLDAMAWTLATIRQHGPIVATPAGLALVAGLAEGRDKAVTAAVCGQSLAILGALSATTTGLDLAALPPVFLAEQGLYDRLPCRDTPAPITPPRTLEACTSSAATGGDGRPVDLWICPEN